MILGLVYLINNWEDIYENDKFFDDQPLPTSLISIVFSFGTTLIGITKAIIYWTTLYTDDKGKEATTDIIEMKEVSA